MSLTRAGGIGYNSQPEAHGEHLDSDRAIGAGTGLLQRTKAEPAYELAAITEVSNVGRAVTSGELELYAMSGNLPTWFSTAS